MLNSISSVLFYRPESGLITDKGESVIETSNVKNTQELEGRRISNGQRRVRGGKMGRKRSLSGMGTFQKELDSRLTILSGQIKHKLSLR